MNTRIPCGIISLHDETQAELDAALAEYEREFVTGDWVRRSRAAHEDALRRKCWMGWGNPSEADWYASELMR